MVESMRMYINGVWGTSASENFTDVVNPATEEVIARVPSGTTDDVRAAVDSAEEAFDGWASLTPLERAKYLFKAADEMEAKKEDLARTITLEQGKPLYEARLEVEGSIENLRYFAEFARRIQGDVLPSDFPNRSVMILRLPLGVVAAITPWNFPSAMVTRKVGPALITGNTVVVKPSSYTPLSAIKIVEAFERAGLPKGVLNLVTGSGSKVGRELVSNNKTQLVTMTGSTEVGKQIMSDASSHVARLILELGGKAPFIVWKDADLAWAVRNALWARFWNAGQTCICAERIYVHREVAERFVTSFVEATRRLRLGDPMGEVDMGPQVSKSELEVRERFVREALKSGGKLLTGGRRPPHLTRGYYYEPTVFVDVDQKSPIVQEEVFGPIVPILEVESLDEAIEKANDSKYGLASYIFTRDLNTALKAANSLRFGETYINQVGPELLQGIHIGFKQSGVGGENSIYGLYNYTQLKTVYVDYSDKPNTPYLFPYQQKVGQGV
ncbi:MAG: aldehyde dehydrogenase [Thermoprotei archaeon]